MLYLLLCSMRIIYKRDVLPSFFQPTNDFCMYEYMESHDHDQPYYKFIFCNKFIDITCNNTVSNYLFGNIYNK